MISKFRIFDTDAPAKADAQADIQNHLDIYTAGPLTKAEMLRRFKEGREVDADFASKFKIKRMGKDLNDIYWALGKIHGLENVVYLNEDTLNRVMGDPW